MNAEQFAYWMQGFVELHGEPPTLEQWASIKEHLQLVFTKVTQPISDAPHAYPSPSSPPYPGSAGDVPWWMRQGQCAVKDPHNDRTMVIC